MAKILIVDDEPANRLLLKTILTYAEHEVSEASNGADGLRLARELHPDLLIVDLFMPEMNGTDFVKALRADPPIAQTNVALYTGTTMSAALKGFMEIAKIEHVIPKPGEPEEVLRAVRAALGN